MTNVFILRCPVLQPIQNPRVPAMSFKVSLPHLASAQQPEQGSAAFARVLGLVSWACCRLCPGQLIAEEPLHRHPQQPRGFPWTPGHVQLPQKLHAACECLLDHPECCPGHAAPVLPHPAAPVPLTTCTMKQCYHIIHKLAPVFVVILSIAIIWTSQGCLVFCENMGA